MIPEPTPTIHHVLTMQLPVTEVITPLGATTLAASTITVTSSDLASKQAAENTVRLLQVLYAHGVTSPDLLRFTLRAAGHPEGRTHTPEATPQTQTPPVPSGLETR